MDSAVRWDMAATCDQHLGKYLGGMTVPGNTETMIRVRRFDTPDARYTCRCGVPAHWLLLGPDLDLAEFGLEGEFDG